MTRKSTQRRSSMAHRETEWALDLELRQLRAFVLLVESGSMSAASRLLGIAQSTMSEGIIALERALGTTIVVRKRGGRGIALTVAGETLLPYARRVIESLEDAHAAVAAVDRDVRARLEVIANESISTYLLPKALAEMRRKWPRLRFAVTVGMCPSITEGLASARYDVGLMLQTGAALRSDVVSLAEVPLALFSRADHPLAARAATQVISHEQLSGYTILISDARGYFFDLVRHFLGANGLPGPRLEATGSVEGVKRGVLADDLGLGVLPLYAIADEVQAARLSRLRIRPELPHMRLDAMSYRTRPPAHPAVATLLDTVRRNVGA